MRRSIRTAGVAAVLAATLGACGGGGGGGQALEGDVAAGEQVFQNSCAECHGEGLKGTNTGPPLIHEYYVPSHHSDEAIQLAVQRGVQPHHWNFGPMPSVPGLSEQEVADVIAYIRTQQREAGLIE